MKIKRGMVIDINLDPTKGSETGRVRPCIVVTNDTYNEKIPVIQVVPITEWSDKKSLIKSNVTIYPSELRLFTSFQRRIFYCVIGLEISCRRRQHLEKS